MQENLILISTFKTLFGQTGARIRVYHFIRGRYIANRFNIMFGPNEKIVIMLSGACLAS